MPATAHYEGSVNYMQTSSFKLAWHFPNSVSIARSTKARGHNYCVKREYKLLAPSEQLISDYKKGRIDKDGYTTRYHNEVLSKLNPQEIFDELGEDAILLCWEPLGGFCHRRIVAKWFEDALGVRVPERIPAIERNKVLSDF